jgi:HEAT repeat protein
VIRDILVAIGSEQTALALSSIISHPVRQVRQNALRVLAELGKAALKVFSRLIEDEKLFVRDADRHELPDAKWYVVRNSIFVLGSLGDPAGVTALRLRINDKDIRVRREIVAALEKIGGEDACDLLIMMADDSEAEINQSAVIAIGLIGKPEVAPLVYDLARRRPLLAPKAIYCLGKLGGDETKAILARLLVHDDELADLAAGQVGVEEIRLAVVKALGNIGDKESLDRLREFQQGLSRTQKLLFRNSSVNRALAEILAKAGPDQT